MILDKKVALVTGASRGIGAATALLLARHGAAVAVNYNKSEAAAGKIVDMIESEGGRAIAVRADVRDPVAVTAMVAAAASLGAIDILVLNAGADVPMRPFTSLSFDDFEGKVMGELKGFFYPLQEIIPGMVLRKSGCIVGISSGLSREPGFGFSAHTTVKSAVDGLMKSLALELGMYGIRVNTVAPGLTITDATARLPKEQVTAIAAATPLRRVAMPEDIAGAVLMMVSGYAGFVTGTYLPVSGGSLMI